MSKKSYPQIIVDISSYSKKGYGFGTFDLNGEKRKVQVKGAVIGDRLNVQIKKRKRGVFLGEIASLIKASNDRVLPRCPHIAKCGGCSWQQLNYAKQLEKKEEIVKELFSSVQPIIASPNIWEYRNKMEFTFSEDKHGEKYLGLIEAGSRGIVLNLNECHLVSPIFMQILSAVKGWWENGSLAAYRPARDEGTLRTLTIRHSSETGSLLVFLTVSGKMTQSQIDSFKEAVLSTGKELSIFLRVQITAKGMETQYYEILLHGRGLLHQTLRVLDRTYDFYLSPCSFFQPNAKTAEKMFAKALEITCPSSEDRVLDLYCGTATIGMIFAPFVKKVISIESNPYAVMDARHNIEVNQIENIEIIQEDVGSALQKLDTSFDLVIIDPPRSGLSKSALDQLLKIAPKKILYISCNPYTQCDDVQKLFPFYLPVYVQPIDQFPHTPHIENMILLDFQSKSRQPIEN